VVKIAKSIAAAGAALWLLLAANPCVAQGAAAAASNPEYQALFKRMYNNPTNVQVTFQFAEVAARLGDYEAAIGALERMLFYNPNQPRVKLELGVLYYKMGGYQIARSYFDQVRKSPGTPPDVLAKVDEFVAVIDRGGSSGSGFHGFVWAGTRYQTNASTGPASLIVRSLGQDVALGNQFGKTPDWNKFVLAGFTYSKDLGDGTALETSFLGYYAKQERLSQFDLGLVELTLGPRFALPQGPFANASWKIYGIGTAASLAQHPYFASPGLGISTRFNLGDMARVEPSYEYRSRRFSSSDIFVTANQQSGKLQTAAITASGSLGGQLPWFGRVAADRNRTDDPMFAFNSYNRLSADIGFPMPFTLTGPDGPHQFLYTPAAGASRTAYLIPNPIIDPVTTRLDREWHASSTLDTQIYANFGLRTQVQYTRTSSSLPNFSTDNFAVSFGPTGRF
jgi:tetratricopeptide (TPR) repeat protein